MAEELKKRKEQTFSGMLRQQDAQYANGTLDYQNRNKSIPKMLAAMDESQHSLKGQK